MVPYPLLPDTRHNPGSPWISLDQQGGLAWLQPRPTLTLTPLRPGSGPWPCGAEYIVATRTWTMRGLLRGLLVVVPGVMLPLSCEVRLSHILTN